MMSNGIAPTDDPILLFRSPAYAASFAKRISGRTLVAAASVGRDLENLCIEAALQQLNNDAVADSLG